MKMDLQAELNAAIQRRESIRNEFMRNEGAISVISYLIENEKKEEPKDEEVEGVKEANHGI